MNTLDLPFVSIIMAIRNEAPYIARSLGAVLAQDYPPECMEVLVVDGCSTDATVDIVHEVAARYSHGAAVRVLHNPKRIVPAAVNIGLAHARGDIIVRVDGHCEIEAGYIRACVQLLETTHADCVGGTIETVGAGRIGQAIALAQSSPFGVGGVAFRMAQPRPGYVDTVAFGAYRRDVFERISTLDEDMVINEDDEFNFRLVQSGGRIWLEPGVRSRYYSRSTFRSLWRQYFRYGFYKIDVIRKRRSVPSWRHLVPAAFVFGLVGSVAVSVYARRKRWAAAYLGTYALACLGGTITLKRGERAVLPLVPLVFPTLHISYGVGFLAGLVRWLWQAIARALQQSNKNRER